MHDEELAASGIRHAWLLPWKERLQYVLSHSGKAVLGELTFDVVARTAHAGSVRTSALDHKSFDNAVEDQTVIIALD